jgi:hypothetical protein
MLSVSDIVNVTVNLAPLAAQGRSFGTLLIAGDSPVISGLQRVRSYTTFAGVALDFSSSDPEYLAAEVFFAQAPQPTSLMIGRFLATATAGFNTGGVLTATQQLLSNFTAVTAGSMQVTIDGGSADVLSSMNFSGAGNLNAVATIITSHLTGAVCTWNGSSFVITSSSTGASSSVGFASPTGSGTDVSTLLQLTSVLSLGLVPGYASETPLQCATALAAISNAWYSLTFAATAQPSDSNNLLVAAFIQAQSISRIFGITTQETATLVSTSTTDLAYELAQGNYTRTFIQYSSSNPYAICSFFGRAATVDFTAQNSTINLMFKQEPTITAENLTESQAATLIAKRCNVFVSYVNNTSIIQQGVMSGPAFFDEIQGLDWLQNAIQTACYNVLYTSGTKIPQTDAGVNQLVNAIAGVCNQAVSNGLCAPGNWTTAGFGSLSTGQFLKSGYYIYAQPVALQSQSDRESRIAPPIQVAIKLAGAVQSMNCIVNVNR